MKKEITDIKVINTKTNKMLKVIDSLDVTNTDEVKKMTDNIKTVKAWVKQEKDKYVAPAKEIIAKAKEQYDPVIDSITIAEKQFKTKVTNHLLELQKKENEAKEKLANRVEKGTMKAETAVRKMQEVGKTENNLGGVTLKMVKNYRIIDESKIPEKYWKRELIKSAIRTDAITNNIEIPGIEVFEEAGSSF
jgi:acyl transferase domain-containing protein